jgi:FtsP/CotA-like multicopper oxidase with cupredoxin domain
MPTSNRREFLASAAALGGALLIPGCARDDGSRTAAPGKGVAAPPDFTLRIAPVLVELAPDRRISTVGYNDSVPGPLLRMREGVPVTVEVHNHTDVPELVHWHGQIVQAEVDGAAEEGTPVVPPHGKRRYTFAPGPAGTRWYHTHAGAGIDTSRGTYSGQFGFVYVEPKSEPGRYDSEVFLATHEWEPFFTSMGEEEGEDEGEPGAPRSGPPPNNGLEIGYRLFSINGKSLGHGEPIRVRQGERVLFHLLNASATEIIRMALPGHRFRVVALDGNPVPTPAAVDVLRLSVGERIDAIVEMNNPGVWVLGTTNDDDRAAGFGIVVEYAGRGGAPRWLPPPRQPWTYAWFGTARVQEPPDEQIEMVFAKVPGGTGGFNRWTINGKSFPHTGPFTLYRGRHYRLVLRNDSDDAHPLHLHRHSFELTRIDGRRTAGILKDIVHVKPHTAAEVDLVATNPGPTLFHCHQQLHMDFGFMALFHYA